MVVGAVLLANPLWIGPLTVYPGTGWGFLPLFHAAFSALGVLLVALGVISLRRSRCAPTVRELTVVAAGTVIFVPLYGYGLTMAIGSDGPLMAGYEFKQALVAALVVAAFMVGHWLVSRRRETVLLGLGVPVIPLVIVVVQWRSGALLGPVVDFWFLFTASPLLDIEYLGTGIFVTAFALGIGIGYTSSQNKR